MSVSKDWAKVCRWKKVNYVDGLGTGAGPVAAAALIVVIEVVAHCSSGKVLEVAVAAGSMACRCLFVVKTASCNFGKVVGTRHFDVVVSL